MTDDAPLFSQAHLMSETSDPVELPPEVDVLNRVDRTLKRLTKQWSLFKRARQDWDFKTTGQSLHAITDHLHELAHQWPLDQQSIQAAITTDQTFVTSADYPAALEFSLKDAGIPVKGNFPTYEFPPFKLTFNQKTLAVKLSMGRRSQQTHIRAIAPLTAWILEQYTQVVNSKFDTDTFCKELLQGYEYLNRLTLNTSAVKWGHPVALKDIYKLLTLRQSSRQEYPESLFTYDLARLREQVEITYGSYRFELVPSRQQTGGFLLINSRGQESRVSSLAIYIYS